MVNCIDNDGNPVRLGSGQPKPTQADFNALLLRAALKGAVLESDGRTWWMSVNIGPRMQAFHGLVVDGLPRPMDERDTDLYERIRKAVDGD